MKKKNADMLKYFVSLPVVKTKGFTISTSQQVRFFKKLYLGTKT